MPRSKKTLKPESSPVVEKKCCDTKSESAEKFKFAVMIIVSAIVIVIVASFIVYLKAGEKINAALRQQSGNYNTALVKIDERLSKLEENISSAAADNQLAIDLAGKKISLTASVGFEIQDYFISNKKDRVAYIENDNHGVYNFFIKTADGVSTFFSSGVNVAPAKLVGWSKNDTKLIVELPIPGAEDSTCALCYSNYNFFDVDTGKSEKLSYIGTPIFYENFRKMIIVSGDRMLPGYNCTDTMLFPVRNMIVLKNIETGATLTLKSDKTKEYQILGLKNNDSILEYKELPTEIKSTDTTLSFNANMTDERIARDAAWAKAPVKSLNLK